MPHDASELSIRRIAGSYRAKLGESPVWTEDGRLAFVDIVAKELLVVTAADAADADDATPKRVRLPTTPGCLVRSKKGGLLVALTVDDAAPDQPGGRLCRVHLPPNGTNASGVAGGDVQDVRDVQDVDPKTTWVCDVLNKNLHPALDDPTTPRTVLNDGAVDAREETLSAVVDVLSSSAKKDRDERTKEENEKLDQVLKDLNDLTKMSKEERDSAEVKAKFESLFEILDVDVSPTMSKEDVKRLKDEVFGYNTFYVTGTSELGEELGVSEGVLVKGNLRADRAEVWKTVQENVERVYEGKYTVFMLEEPPADFFGDDDDGGSGAGASMSGSYDASDPTNTRGPRISFLIVPASKAGPNPRTSAFQYVVAIALFGLTAGSALQLGLVAEVSRLPQATMDWLAAGSQGIDTNLAPGELPPGLDGFDSAAYIAGAVPIAGGIYASAAAHEIGHWIAAATKKIKLSIPYPIPNGQLGTFGSITQIKSLPENRTDLYDVSVAGPIGGFTVASALFFYGLALSAGGGDPNELLPIPNELFQGSLMLGAISEAILGGTADQVKGVAVHPLFIAGWCVRFGFGRSGRSSSRRTEAVFFSRPLARASCPRTTTHHIDLTVARCYPPALKSAGDFCRTALGGTLP